MEILGILLLLAFPVAAIAAFVMVVGTRDKVRVLEARIVALEQRPTTPGVTPAAAASEPPRPKPVPLVPPPIGQPIVEPPPPAEPRDPVLDALVAGATLPEQPPPQPPAQPPAPPPESFEERFGTRWVVWVGGLALALGGIFLVQYSIEAGLIGPGVRVFLGALLAAVLIAAGEWMRRQDRLGGVAGLSAAHIPSILTAAGTTVAYADVYAAYALYGFVSPAAAFVLLGIVALATLAAALLHGPALAALGQVGAFLAPALVATPEPNYWALYLYLAIVTAASFALARARLWLWLALTAVVLGVLWSFPGIADLRFAPTPVAFYTVVCSALAAALLVSGLLFGPAAAPGRIEPFSSGAIAAYLSVAAVLVIAREHDGIALIAFTLLAGAAVAIAWRAESATLAVPVAGALAALVIADWAVEIQWTTLAAPGGLAPAPDPSRAHYGAHLALGGAFAALFGAAGFLAQGRSERPEAPLCWAAAAVLTPLAILIALYYRVADFERSIPFAALALLLAALFAVATELLTRRAPRPGLASAAALFATGAVAALALGLTFALEKGWLTIALALMVPGIAWIADQRPLPWLRVLAAALVVLVLARVAYDPRIVGRDVGTTPIFNWILYGYGVPALSFWLAGWLLRRRADDEPARMTNSAAILFTVLTVFLEIRHFIYGGNVYYPSAGLTEIALQVCAGLAMTIGLERVRMRTGNVVHDTGALIIAVLTLAGILFGLMLIENPLWNRVSVGGPFINLILLGYGVPAVLTAVLGLMTRQTRPEAYRTVAAVTAVALALAYLTLETARLFRGPVLPAVPLSDAEQYTHSAVWLAFGVALLVIGIYLRSQPVRLCSAAVVLIVIAKVFLFDMAGLSIVWRSLSFLGLGAVLVGIGRVYQRLLFPRAIPPPQGEGWP